MSIRLLSRRVGMQVRVLLAELNKTLINFQGFLIFMSYFLYILKSLSADKFYVGISANPELRLSYHNSFEKGMLAFRLID